MTDNFTKQRLTFVMCSAFPAETGGRENWLSNLITRIHGDYHVTIICKRSPSSRSLYGIPKDVTVIRIPAISSVPVLGKSLMRSYVPVLDCLIFSVGVFFYLLCRGVRADEISIAMGTVYEATPLRWLTRNGRKYCYICSVRGRMADDVAHSFPLLGRVVKRIEHANLLYARQVWSNGLDTTTYLNHLGFDSVLMKNGVDCCEFAKPEERCNRPEFIDRNLTNITMIAALREIRGIETAIKACVCLAQRKKGFRMLFVGKGGQGQWKKLATELGAVEHVVFAGERTDIADILHFSDVALTLCDERFGAGVSMALLESMASGKPIVAWRNAIYSQLLDDHGNALLVPENDPQSLACAIEELIEDADLRGRMGSSARESALAYDWSEVVSDFRKHVELLEHCLRGRSPT